jgi:hypothetical protein
MTAQLVRPDLDPRAELRHELLTLARRHESLAASEAARVPYWEPCPASVAGHRAAAILLREDAEQLRLG